MHNRRVKFGLKIPNHLGKNVRKFQGGFFLTHTVHVDVNNIVLSRECTCACMVILIS